MTLSSLKIATALLAVSASSAFAADYAIESTVTVAADTATVWQVIGDFCDIDDWHPGIVACVLESRNDSVHRQLTLGDGVAVIEKLTSLAPGVSYSYEIVEAPLPITGYASTISVSGGMETTVKWVGTFQSDVPDMKGAIQGLYDGGLAALSARFAK